MKENHEDQRKKTEEFRLMMRERVEKALASQGELSYEDWLRQLERIHGPNFGPGARNLKSSATLKKA